LIEAMANLQLIFYGLSTLILSQLAVAQEDDGSECGPPSILPWPTNTSALEWTPGSFSCPLDTVNSCLVDMVQWYRVDDSEGNGRVKLSAEPRVTAYPFNPLRLFFDTVRAEDQGWYLCRVGNAKGVATGTHYLKVTPNPAGKPTPAPTPAPEENADSSVVGGALSGEAKRYFETGRILDDMTEAAGAGSMGPPVTARPPFPSPIAEGAEVSSSTDTSELTRHIDALHQHLKYIYYKFDQLEKRINSIESKVY